MARLKRWGPALVMMLLIFLASSIPSQELPDFEVWDTLVKKGGHMLGYALLAAAYLRGLAPAGGRPARREILTAVLLASLYAVSDEFHQSFVPGRESTPADVGIDVLGAMTGVWVREYVSVRVAR